MGDSELDARQINGNCQAIKLSGHYGLHWIGAFVITAALELIKGFGGGLELNSGFGVSYNRLGRYEAVPWQQRISDWILAKGLYQG